MNLNIQSADRISIKRSNSSSRNPISDLQFDLEFRDGISDLQIKYWISIENNRSSDQLFYLTIKYLICRRNIQSVDGIIQSNYWCSGVVVITTVQLYSTKSELRFCADSNTARGVSDICDGKNLCKCSLLEIRLNPFRLSTIPQKQFIIIKYSSMRSNIRSAY